MKITLPRRTRTFIAKWGGVVLAALMVIPIAFFGGTYLMANSRLDHTLNYVTQAVSLQNIIPAGPTADLPPDYIYHLFIVIQNDTPDAADVSITDASISLGNMPFEITGSAGWTGRVPARDYIVFEGDIKVLRQQSRELEDKVVPVKISGYITVKARYGFVEKEETRLLKALAEATFPRPTTVTPTEVPPPATATP
jgi:hypothetical protein